MSTTPSNINIPSTDNGNKDINDNSNGEKIPQSLGFHHHQPSPTFKSAYISPPNLVSKKKTPTKRDTFHFENNKDLTDMLKDKLKTKLSPPKAENNKEDDKNNDSPHSSISSISPLSLTGSSESKPSPQNISQAADSINMIKPIELKANSQSDIFVKKISKRDTLKKGSLLHQWKRQSIPKKPSLKSNLQDKNETIEEDEEEDEENEENEIKFKMPQLIPALSITELDDEDDELLEEDEDEYEEDPKFELETDPDPEELEEKINKNRVELIELATQRLTQSPLLKANLTPKQSRYIKTVIVGQHPLVMKATCGVFLNPKDTAQLQRLDHVLSFCLEL